MCTEMSKCRIEVEDWLNGIGSVYPNIVHCMRTWRKGNRIVQRHGSHDGGLSCRSYNSADRERHSKSFFDIVEYVLRGPGGETYTILGSVIMRISYILWNVP